jgi:adenine/guanine phosphoribosyltransferase-like PRPP-binding protein
MDELLSRITDTVRTVPDFPIEGVMFRDITPVLGEPGLLSSITDRFAGAPERNVNVARR